MGLHGFASTEPDAASGPLELLTRGALDTLHGRYRFRRPDGSQLELWCWIRAIRSPCGPDLGLVYVEAAHVGDSPTQIMGLPSVRTIPNAYPNSADSLGVLRLDERWTVSALARANSPAAFESSLDVLIGHPFLSAVHPDDRTSAVCAFALATSGARVGVWLRLRADETSTRDAVASVVTFSELNGAYGFVVELYQSEDRPGTPSAARAAELERRLRRIAAEIRAVDLLEDQGSQPDLLGIPGLPELSARQIEIVERLLNGERVPAIASEMFLSQTTIRNHLTTVFRKFGVHSQSELIAAIRRLAQRNRRHS
jgi:DNA-binding CsgD family transcriptional regulator